MLSPWFSTAKGGWRPAKTRKAVKRGERVAGAAAGAVARRGRRRAARRESGPTGKPGRWLAACGRRAAATPDRGHQGSAPWPQAWLHHERALRPKCTRLGARPAPHQGEGCRRSDRRAGSYSWNAPGPLGKGVGPPHSSWPLSACRGEVGFDAIAAAAAHLTPGGPAARIHPPVQQHRWPWARARRRVWCPR